MPSLLSGVQLALQAVLSHQQAVEVIENNVANANTPGYRRQTAVLKPAPPYETTGLQGGTNAGQMGTGVLVERIDRFSVDFYDRRYRQASAEARRWETQQDVLQQLESSLGENTQDGLLPKLDDFWSGWRSLSGDPSNLSLRQDLLDRSQALAEAFHTRINKIDALIADQTLAVTQRVQEVNSLTQQVAHLNGEISRVLSIGNQPNDLMDQRDLLLDRLSELAGAVSSAQANGEVLVSIGGQNVVTGHDAFAIDTRVEPDTGNLLLVDPNGRAFDLTSGELPGLLAARNEDLPAQKAGLNALASSLVERVNALHSGGFGLDGSTGIDFFTGSDAASIQVNSTLDDVANIAAAGAAGAAGDGEIARQISNVQAETLAALGGATAHDYYNARSSALGLQVQRVSREAQDYGLAQDALKTQRDSLTGVSLDEEAANLVKSQRAYEAATRLMTVIDQMLDQVINNMGIVGR